MKNETRVLAALFAATAMVGRLVPHPPNFTPAGALALFAGAYLAGGRWAVGLPLCVLAVTDALIGFYDPRLMVVVYASLLANVLIGRWIRRQGGILPVGAGTLAGSVMFFLTTNFATWLFSGMYPKTGAGLLTCYVAAIPFFQNSLLGDFFYVAAFFGTCEAFFFLARRRPARAHEKAGSGIVGTQRTPAFRL